MRKHCRNISALSFIVLFRRICAPSFNPSILSIVLIPFPFFQSLFPVHFSNPFPFSLYNPVFPSIFLILFSSFSTTTASGRGEWGVGMKMTAKVVFSRLLSDKFPLGGLFKIWQKLAVAETFKLHGLQEPKPVIYFLLHVFTPTLAEVRVLFHNPRCRRPTSASVGMKYFVRFM
jgi:hypothetical protein